MAATQYRCLRDCYHNMILFKKNEVYPRSRIGAGKVPHHFKSIEDIRKEKSAEEAEEAKALDGEDTSDLDEAFGDESTSGLLDD